MRNDLKFYQHRITGQIIGSCENLRELIGTDGKRQGCLTEVIIPDYKLGNGIISCIMDYRTIKDNYKKISVKKAAELFPDFGQYRHINDVKMFYNSTIEEHYEGAYYQLAPMRKIGFGIAFCPK